MLIKGRFPNDPHADWAQTEIDKLRGQLRQEHEEEQG